MEASPSNKRRRMVKTRRQQEEIIEEGEQDRSQVSDVISVPVKCRPGQMYIAEPDQMWNKLKSSGIMPVATLDLNW